MTPSMARHQALSRVLRSSIPQIKPFPFLIPLNQQTTSFSTTKPTTYPRDLNRSRGVSAIRRTGPREPLSVSNEPLPTPVLDPSRRPKVEVDEDHGLWDFFHSKDKPMNTPEEDAAIGRPWQAQDLRGKSWEDLHALYWVCAKERNRISTEAFERERLKAGYGELEAQQREQVVRRTQRAIKQVLTERYYAWEDARKLARNDPEVDLSGQGPPYTGVGENIFEDEEEGVEYTAQEREAIELEKEARAIEEETRIAEKPNASDVKGVLPPHQGESNSSHPV